MLLLPTRHRARQSASSADNQMVIDDILDCV